MRRNLKTLGLSFLAVFLLGAIAAASASAAQPTFEIEGGGTTTFSGSGKGGTLETIEDSGGKHHAVSCTGSKSAGTVNSSSKATKITVTFTGCTSSGTACTTAGANSGEIITKALEGELFFREKGTTNTVLLLKPEGGGNFAEFKCGFGLETISVAGNVAGDLTPVNSLTNSFTLSFAQTSGVPSPGAYESSSCALTSTLLETTGSGPENFSKLDSGIKGSETVTTTKKVKILVSPTC
jgi:hypothetical protein